METICLETMTDNELILLSGGQNVIDVGCAVFGGIAWATGGAILAHPAGAAAGMFCAGWAIGRLFW